MKVHSCNYCSYQSDRLYNLKVHHKNKHGNQPYQATTKLSVGHNGSQAPTIVSIPPLYSVQSAATHQHVSNPHPYVHPYLQQQPNPYPQRTPEMIANNTYYAKETRAPTKISVGPDGQRAPTTVQAAATHQHVSNPHPCTSIHSA